MSPAILLQGKRMICSNVSDERRDDGCHHSNIRMKSAECGSLRSLEHPSRSNRDVGRTLLASRTDHSRREIASGDAKRAHEIKCRGVVPTPQFLLLTETAVLSLVSARDCTKCPLRTQFARRMKQGRTARCSHQQTILISSRGNQCHLTTRTNRPVSQTGRLTLTGGDEIWNGRRSRQTS